MQETADASFDIASFSLESHYGIWVAQVSFRPKSGSKGKRTFGKPEFRLFTEAEGGVWICCR